MLTSVLTKTVRDQARGLIGWGIGVSVLVALIAALWPSVRDMNLEGFLGAYPEVFRELFNIESIATGPGFLNAELFSIILPALFIIYAVGRGARLVAGEEEGGTLDLLVVTPVSRRRLLVEKAAGLAVGVTVLGGILFVVLVLSSAAFGIELGSGPSAVAALAMVLLGIEHGWLSLAVGAATGRRVTALAVAGSVAVAGYLLFALGAIVDVVEPWRPLSPFTHALEAGPLNGGVPMKFALMPLAALAFLAAAVPLFAWRSLAGR